MQLQDTAAGGTFLTFIFSIISVSTIIWLQLHMMLHDWMWPEQTRPT